jgi:hypothetical protein
MARRFRVVPKRALCHQLMTIDLPKRRWYEMNIRVDSEVLVLDHWTEIVGTLHEVLDGEGSSFASIGVKKVALPSRLKEALRPHIGSRIAILRTDLHGKEYLVRRISETNHIEEVDHTAPNVH